MSMSTAWLLKGADDGCKSKAGTRYTEVMLDGWREDGLGGLRDDGGGCATMRSGEP